MSGDFRRPAALFGVLALEQRVPFELSLDEARKLEVGKLQELDRLLELRRHHQTVGLAEFELCGDRHYPNAPAINFTQILNWSPR